ncbi:T/G mismatch-specific endonuclease [Marinobacter sp. es.042]|uniref:very short patch repair endonuclease n=1 Tax=Marinobacter sp. es.042 TaxID=1761794 RepID=UPI000B500D57|nr:very short patch repair endonuclease [Marinobacter sp. es.042]SNB59307.1 T/G mismatch-specific endonuclease [Marinobacter sp. es.042]
MTDIVDSATRSRMMSKIKGKNTKPEIMVRSALHQEGYRFRLHRKNLPGKPDIVLPKYRAAIFVNGCFWHGHGCSLFKWPKTREEFWKEKINANINRDQRNQAQLADLGWRVCIVWECSIRGKSSQTQSEKLVELFEWLKSEALFAEIYE